ncbi:LysM peptidoglycan-binding domain-containing protein [Pontibacillus salicampi]|uniref:LysM peptidoglycan-binding domain-containing protein n=1 Tax=Pontibacillus salicampi TaxID=1449801 RepID=A0ABV6LLZ4_9BACI
MVLPALVLGASLTFPNLAQAEENYKVKSGDTLWGISKDYNTSVSSLKNWNNLSGDIIYVGQTITIGESSSKATSHNTSSQHSSNTYTVKAGDTLWGISISHGTSVSKIKQLNGLSGDIIYVGQKLSLSGSTSNQSHSTSNNTSSQTTKSNTSNTSSTSGLISEAKQHIGTPYKWAGTSPSGFDCSGYIHYVFKQEGISVPRTTSSLWSAGQRVSSPSVGDIVFFETYKSGPSHAGIYVGNNKFIHAGYSRGVEVSSMDNSYWSPRYLGAKSLH